MAVRKTTKKLKRTVHRKRPLRLNKGAASIGVILILLLVFFIFIMSMLFPSGGFFPQTGNITTGSVAVPTLSQDTGGGMQVFQITPLPSSYNSSMCQLLTNDVVLLLDSSGSMRGDKLYEAKAAAKLFIDLIAINPQSRASVVTFDQTSRVLIPLTNDFLAVKSKIDELGDRPHTCIQCGVVTANEQLSASLRDNVKRSVVLLSDGKGNYVDGKSSKTANKAALDAISSGYSSHSASYYTIAIGKDADKSFMQQTSTVTNGGYYDSTNQNGMANAFATVATDICNE